jgi:hypothetical protein
MLRITNKINFLFYCEKCILDFRIFLIDINAKFYLVVL